MTIFNYTVNYVDIGIAAIFLLLALIGYHRGLIINVVNFIRYTVGLFLCFYLSHNLYLPLYEVYVRERALQYIQEKLIVDTNLDATLQNLQEFGNSLPVFLQNSFSTEALTLSSDDLAQTILVNVFEPLLFTVLKAAIFIAVFLLFFGATGLLIRVAQRRSRKKEEKNGKKSVLKKTDKLLGGVLGIMKAAVIVLAITSVLVYYQELNESDAPSAFMQEVQSSSILQILDSINPFNTVTEGLI